LLLLLLVVLVANCFYYCCWLQHAVAFVVCEHWLAGCATVACWWQQLHHG